MVLIVCMIMITSCIIKLISYLQIRGTKSIQSRNSNQHTAIESQKSVRIESYPANDHDAYFKSYRNRLMPSIMEEYDLIATATSTPIGSGSDENHNINRMEKVISNSEDNSPASKADTEPEVIPGSSEMNDMHKHRHNVNTPSQLKLDMEVRSEKCMTEISKSRAHSLPEAEHIVQVLSRLEGQEGRQESMVDDTTSPTNGVNTIRIWLDVLDLSQNYLNLFLENGYDTVDYIKAIEDEADLKEIGIVYEEDIEKLMKAIEGANGDENMRNQDGDVDVMEEALGEVLKKKSDV